MSLVEIVSGHIKELLNLEAELYRQRISICRKCKLYNKDTFLGEVCDAGKWYNPKTDTTSLTEIDGYYNGCGCRLDAKTRIREARCPLNKWKDN